MSSPEVITLPETVTSNGSVELVAVVVTVDEDEFAIEDIVVEFVADEDEVTVTVVVSLDVTEMLVVRTCVAVSVFSLVRVEVLLTNSTVVVTEGCVVETVEEGVTRVLELVVAPEGLFTTRKYSPNAKAKMIVVIIIMTIIALIPLLRFRRVLR